MAFSHRPNRALGVRRTQRDRYQQAFGQRFEVKSAIETVGEGSQIVLCIFSKAKATLAAAQPSEGKPIA